MAGRAAAWPARGRERRLRRLRLSAIAAPGMTTALHPGSDAAMAREALPGQTMADRQRMAVRDLSEAARLWNLCWTLAWFDIKLRYRGSMLGPFWLTLSTGVMVAAMGLIYSTLFRMPLQEYLPFLAVSQVLWGFLATLVGDSCTGYTAAESMIRSIRMPFSLYGARIVLRNLLVLAHNMLVIVVVDMAFSAWPGIIALLALPALALWLLDAVAITVLLGALCARFRDIPPIVASVMQMAFFITPVMWKPELVGAHQWMLPYNPFYTLLEIVRGPLLGEIPTATVYGSALLSSAVICIAAWTLFARVRGRIAFWV
jgi:lipopolysaccharide transport system permease protein